MKAFTQTLPRLLEKLEVVRQVLETHGITSEMYDRRRSGSDSMGTFHWTWRRGDILLRASLHMTRFEWNGVALEMSVPEEARFGGERGVIVTCSNEAWNIRINLDTDSALSPFAETLPQHDKGAYNESVAREAMGMIAAFFAKLPVDAPAEGDAT